MTGLSYSKQIDNTDFQIVREGNRCGVINSNEKIIIPCDYDYIEYRYSFDIFVVSLGNDLLLFDSSGSKLIDSPCDDTNTIENRFDYSKGDNGNFDLHPLFVYSKRLSNNTEGIGFFSKKQLFDYELTKIDLRSTIIIAQKNSKYGIIHRNDLKIVVDFKFDKIENELYYIGNKFGIYQIDTDDKNSFFNLTEIMDVSYEFPFPEDEFSINGKNCLEGVKDYNLFRIMKNGKIGVFNRASRTILIPCEYDSFEYFDTYSDNKRIFKVRKGDYESLINEEGKLLREYEYNIIERRYLIQHIYFVKRNGLWGLVDRSFQEILPCQYESINSYTSNWSGKGLFITERIVDTIYSTIIKRFFLANRRIEEIKKELKYGVIDVNGIIRADNIYEKAQIINKGRIELVLDGKTTIIYE